MSGQDVTFRVNVRFNRVEYSDLDKDLSRYTGANKGARKIGRAACRERV